MNNKIYFFLYDPFLIFKNFTKDFQYLYENLFSDALSGSTIFLQILFLFLQTPFMLTGKLIFLELNINFYTHSYIYNVCHQTRSLELI